ncbi:PfkB family carbohydrate kinase [Amycolatopsis sp. NPDC051373]|uniref:PfkB family carbohydrate kinase n=1 Tax=Amycolatopsis sp. NPDC051373 TaxID=3155801 RepID=UPI00344DED82
MLLAGLCTVDVVQRVSHFPAPGEKVQSLRVDVAAGGPATNAAVTVAALGAAATLVTVVGAHPLSALAHADLIAYGVDVVDLDPARTDSPPVSAVVVRDSDGERTVVSRNAASGAPVEVPDLTDLTGLVRQADAVLVDGHHPELALAVARAARSLGVPVVLDAGSWKPVVEDLLPLVDVAACSAHFAAPGPGLRERGVPVVIRTAGPDPVRWSTAEDSGQVPVNDVEARDTLAAGDVWHGALAHAVAAGGSSVDGWIRHANAVAAERVRHVGPRSWTAAISKLGEGVR